MSSVNSQPLGVWVGGRGEPWAGNTPPVARMMAARARQVQCKQRQSKRLLTLGWGRSHTVIADPVVLVMCGKLLWTSFFWGKASARSQLLQKNVFCTECSLEKSVALFEVRP